MSGAQWSVLGLLLIAFAIELATRPSARAIFVRLMHTFNIGTKAANS
jgi:hypothetical protein